MEKVFAELGGHDKDEEKESEASGGSEERGVRIFFGIWW
jgi:hypothetical protein